ncbi:MAG: metallophosphoesterase family protein, partial [Candidatus Thorarchaeota archaeon]
MITEQSVKLRSQDRPISRKRLVIISDTHITRAEGAFNLHAFNLGIEQINKIKNVSLYLHLGDVTHLGTLLDYEFALEQFKKFDPVSKSPIMVLIGNHDALNVG